MIPSKFIGAKYATLYNSSKLNVPPVNQQNHIASNTFIILKLNRDKYYFSILLTFINYLQCYVYNLNL